MFPGGHHAERDEYGADATVACRSGLLCRPMRPVDVVNGLPETREKVDNTEILAFFSGLTQGVLG